MQATKEQKLKKERRQRRTRAKITGTALRPRLNIFRSNKGMYLQIIDDETGRTLASVSSREIKEDLGRGDGDDEKVGRKVQAGFALGKMIAERALAKKITKIVFDRGAYKYHGRVKAVAEGARSGGLEF